VARFPLTTVKPAPEMEACETFTVAVPVFVTLRLSVDVDPTATLPKLNDEELGDRTPAPGAWFCAAALV